MKLLVALELHWDQQRFSLVRDVPTFVSGCEITFQREAHVNRQFSLFCCFSENACGLFSPKTESNRTSLVSPFNFLHWQWAQQSAPYALLQLPDSI